MALLLAEKWTDSDGARATRDMAIVGATSSALGIWWVFDGLYGWKWMTCAALMGLLSGLLVGPLLQHLRHRRFFTLPATLLAGGPVLGALWGGLVGVTAATLANVVLHQRRHVPEGFCLAVGATCGALQFGWLWLPWAWRRARGRSTWPVVVASVVVAPGLWFAGAAIWGVLGRLFR